MKSIYYDFSEFIEILNDIRYSNGKSSDLNKLKNELNRFFKGQKCREVLYTNNTDKVFFTSGHALRIGDHTNWANRASAYTWSTSRCVRITVVKSP